MNMEISMQVADTRDKKRRFGPSLQVLTCTCRSCAGRVHEDEN